jgi:circadian clock protein KaiC
MLGTSISAPAREFARVTGRLSSGQPPLDGLPQNAIDLLIGLPGSGWTILAEQYAFANATEERPALYLSTVSELSRS